MGLQNSVQDGTKTKQLIQYTRVQRMAGNIWPKQMREWKKEERQTESRVDGRNPGPSGRYRRGKKPVYGQRRMLTGNQKRPVIIRNRYVYIYIYLHTCLSEHLKRICTYLNPFKTYVISFIKSFCLSSFLSSCLHDSCWATTEGIIKQSMSNTVSSLGNRRTGMHKAICKTYKQTIVRCHIF